MRRVGDLPPNAPPPEKGIQLAVGETSGHWHEVDGTVLERPSLQQRGRVLVHSDQVVVGGMPDRHTPLDTPPGLYEFWIQREYSPEAIRNVAD